MSSVFDVGHIPDFKSDDLARARTLQAASIFEYLALKEVSTHFRRLISPVSLHVDECQVQDKPLLSGQADYEMVGLEVLFRMGTSEKFCGRVKRGEIDFNSFEFLKQGQRLRPGVTFKKPYVEASTKWDDLDGYLTVKQASNLTDMSKKDVSRLYRWVGQIGQHLDDLFTELGYSLVDGKVEVARDKTTGGFILIDGISLDELGVMKGDEHWGKNLLRNEYKRNHPKWYAELEAAQEAYPKDKTKWPNCPPLSDEVKDLHVGRYAVAAEDLDKYVATLAA